MKLFSYSLALAACIITACAGPSSQLQQSTLSRVEANEISLRLSAAIEKRYPLLEHRGVKRYVEALGQYLVSRDKELPPLAYEFRVLKTNEVLSFSTPTGLIYVSLGLLRICDMEGQFAAAVAHELAHLKLGHLLKFWGERMQSIRSAGSGQAWTDKVFGKDGLFYYGEGMEHEADQMALLVLYRASFDSRVQLSLFKALVDAENTHPQDMSPILSLWPPSLQRLNWSKQESLRVPPVKDGKLNSSSFAALQQLLKKAAQKAKIERPRADDASSESSAAGL